MAAFTLLCLAPSALLVPRAAAPPRCAVRCCAPVDGVEPAAAPIDPRKAVEELGGLLEQIKVLWTESASWSAGERVERRRELINTYVRVFAPALAFSGTQVAISLGAFLTVLLGLQLGGRGYADVYRLSGALPPLRSALEQLDPAWGNAAIALLAVELSAPLLIAATLAATPAATANLQAQLTEWNLDADRWCLASFLSCNFNMIKHTHDSLLLVAAYHASKIYGYG